MTLLISNIKMLVHTRDDNPDYLAGKNMSALRNIENAFLLTGEDRIIEFGVEKDDRLDKIRREYSSPTEIDAGGGMVFPSWCDAHTHIVYAGNRENEFVDRIRGLSYQEIYRRGGGILNSAAKLRKADEQELFDSAMKRIEEIKMLGTGAVEIKSGYGLTVESELKMLRVIRRISQSTELTVKATLLAAHAIPEEYKDNKDGYLSLIMNEIIPAVAQEKLADYCDIFCEKNYFTHDDAMRLFEAAGKHGLIPKVHAEQMSHSGGIEAGVKSGAISVDHLEQASDEDIGLLKGSGTMPVLLPGAQFFLGLQNPPARKMIDSGLPVAIASDYNPGSCPSGNMNQMVSFACIMYRLTPDEAIIAATTNTAYAMGLHETHGHIGRGMKANFFITEKISSPYFLPYSFGSNLIRKVILNGKIIN